MRIRRLILVLLIINVFLLSFLTPLTQVSAAYSKVATAAAKKVAKEVVVDLSIEMAEDIIFQYQMEQWLSGKYETENGYTPVCLDKKDMSEGETCSKPAQVKTEIKDTDKRNLANTIEGVLETKTGVTGWMKFLDWFVPLFLVSGAAVWIETQFDSDTENLFDEVAREALLQSGYMKSIVSSVSSDGGLYVGDTPINEADFPSDPQPTVVRSYNAGASVVRFTDYEDVKPVRGVVFRNTGKTFSTWTNALGATDTGLKSYRNTEVGFYVQRNISTSDSSFDTERFLVDYSHTNVYTPLFSMTNDVVSVLGHIYGSAYKLYKNGSLLQGEIVENSAIKFSVDFDVNDLFSVLISPAIQDVSWIQSNFPDFELDKVNPIGFYYYYKITTLSGDEYVIETFRDVITTTGHSSIAVREDHTVNTNTDVQHQLAVITNMGVVESFPPFEPLVPDFPSELPSRESGKKFVVPSPSTVEITTPDGQRVQPSPDSTTGWKTMTGEDISVNEDTLIVGEVNTESINGTKPENPNDNEVLACERDLKDIEFEKVGDAFTNAFPFSIPWDIKRFIDNALGGVGNEKPSVELSFLGDGIVLTIPEFFDNWMPFLRGLLIILFDISIIYMFYRFMKGGSD